MDNLRQYLKENPDFTLWEYLGTVSKPIVIYGMGDGAEKIISVLQKKGIEYSDIFASDGFVRGQIFRGIKVKTFSQIKELYKDFVILVAFATRQAETVAMLKKMAQEYEMFVPDVNVSGDYTQVFDSDYYAQNFDCLYNTFCVLEQQDRETFCRILDFKISGKLEYLDIVDSLVCQPYNRYNIDLIENYVDLGAYNGDTLKSSVELHKNLKSAVLMEPDTKNFKKLCLYTSELELKTEVYNNAAWNCECEMTLHMGFGKNTTLGNISEGLQKKKDIIIKAVPPDSVTDKADLIKYDVEGSEYQALQGSERLIRECRPVLIVSAYHNNNDLFTLVPLIKEYHRDYKIYLSRKPCIPAWELEFVAVSKKYSV